MTDRPPTSRAAPGWRRMDTAPKDGTRILAWSVAHVDEYDENDNLIAKGKREECACIIQWFIGGWIENPLKPSFPRNVDYVNWQPLPERPAP